MQNNKHFGLEAEGWFREQLAPYEQHGLQWRYRDLWYDYDLVLRKREYKVEVKSCALARRHGKKEPYLRMGRFDFTNKESRGLLQKEDVAILFVVRYRGKILPLGFIRGKHITKRYYSISEVCSMNPQPLDEWMSERWDL